MEENHVLFSSPTSLSDREGIAIRALRIIVSLLAAAAAVSLCYMMVQKKLEPGDVSIPEPEILYTGEDFVMDTFVTQKVSAGNGGLYKECNECRKYVWWKLQRCF